MTQEELSDALNGIQLSEGLIRIEESLPLSGKIGSVPLQRLNRSPLLPGETEFSPSIYLDTETTGLAGGSGTLAFLVGIATVEERAVRLTQFLITSFSAESALLNQLADTISEDHRLVSYNGKSYDLPLLITRFRMQGLQPPFDELDHLDLLHPVRRLYGRRWPDCRLETVENRLLSLSREDDLPDAEAPEAWFAYMRTGDGERLIKTVEHNRQDILSLIAAHHVIAEAVQSPVEQNVDLYGLARWQLQIDEAEALDLPDHHSEHLCDDGKRLLGQLLRRNHLWESAVPIWESLAERGCLDSIERLAKYHEHVSKNLITALQYCRMLPGSEPDEYRFNRLEKKLRRAC
ncbi:MAG: ribonuclease H-like domain-containing protein [Pseudomonadota bacterium]|nr:ribonuclease H-like domain-containing protein [Pseudomonadota bacterium]